MTSPGSDFADVQAAGARDALGIPFHTQLSLVPLVEFWTTRTARVSPVHGGIARLVDAELEAAPELRAPIADPAVLTRHAGLVDLLMALVFPPVFRAEEFGAALAPFELRPFFTTPSFARTLMDGQGRLLGRLDVSAERAAAVRTARAYALVLERVYGMQVDMHLPPFTLTITDAETGLDRHFQLNFDTRFVEVVPTGAVPSLDRATLERLRGSLLDGEALSRLLDPEHFTLRGFTLLQAVEVTDQEVLSSLQRDLIDRESLVSNARFDALQAKLRTLLRRPAVHLGLAAIEGDQVFKLHAGARMEHACIFADSSHRKTSDFAGSHYDRAARSGQPVIVEDLAACADRTSIEDEILRAGFRNLLIAPLHYQGELIGMLDLASTVPGDLDATHLPRLQQVLPLFSMAVRRSQDELEGRIQAFIKEKATAIHPSVEWRFRKAVLQGLERMGGAGTLTEIDPIVFHDVYPLYGLSDIRGSSTQRAFAIQADLLTQLSLARDVVRAAHDVRPLPALDELAFRIERHMAQVEVSLRSGDETALIAFLHTEVEPVFEHVQDFGPGVRAAVEAYRAALEPSLGTVYRRRRAFEESVTALSDTISAYLDMEQQAAQAIVPHYFEKQKTDGVDYGIYVGASLLEDGRFDPLLLRSLRLWQLMVTCGAALRAERLKDQLPIPLETTHLILAHHAPLAIRFRADEKRFDVDGAYNMRYQIVKKRIDKAVIRDTTERLTQPGRIAIVYSHPAEAAEYREYLAYLHHLGYIDGHVEDLELEELQGVQGLRALRVTVELDPSREPSGSLALRARA